jgi:hypothetical protein
VKTTLFVLKTSTDVLSKVRGALLFLYFALSSGELLHFVFGIYKPKAGHIVALLLLGWVLLEKKAWRIPRPLMQAFCLILGSLIVSALFGAAPMRSLGYIGVYLFNFCLYFFLPYQMVQTMDLDRFMRIYWSSFVMVGLYAVMQVGLSLFGIYEPFALQRVGSLARGQAWTYEPSYYALYILPYVMYQNGMALFREKTRGLKLFCQNMMMAVSTSTGLIVSYPAFFACAMINPLREHSRKKLKKAVLFFLLSIGAATIFIYETALNTLFKFFYFGFSHGSFAARWDGIVACCKMFIRHPILGAGLGGVSTERFQEESTYDFKMITLQEFEAYDPTNCLTEVLASLGLVGLMTFIYLGIVFYRAFQDVIKNDAIDLSVKKTATALFLSLAVMIIALQMNQGLFRPYVWIHAAVVYGFLSKVRAQNSGELHHVDGCF